MHFRTLVSSSTSSIIRNLRNLTPEKPQNTTLLFTISANAPGIEEIATHLRHQARYTVGCLSAPFAGEMRSHTVCSVAYFNVQDCIPFRSELVGRPTMRMEDWNYSAATKRLPDYSREVSPWSAFESPEEVTELPNELLNYRDLGSVVFFSDNSPHRLTCGLNSLRPNVNHLGLVASSTPFVTGRPYTLLYGDKVYSSGAIGLAFKRSMPPPSVTYNGITPFSKEMKATKSIGNLIFEIDKNNPVQKLERAIESVARIPGKGDVYLIAAYNEENKSHIVKVYQITAGSPSRGSLSLEGDYAPKANQFVKFCTLDPNAFSMALNKTALMNTPVSLMNFMCSWDPEDTPPRSENENETDDCQVFENSFIAVSENGLILTEKVMSSISASKYGVPGTVGTWHFQ